MSGSSFGFLLRPKWIAFHLLVVLGIVLMVRLGFWQLDRLDERRDFNATVEERIDQPPVPLEDLLAEPDIDPAGLEWRQVTAQGSWLSEQVLWFNRSQDGLAGDNVLTALVDGDTTLVVNRGFVPLGVDAPAPPAGEVEVLARVRIPQERQLGELTDDVDGTVTEIRRVDLGVLAAQLPGEVAPVYLDLVATIPAVGGGDPTPVPAPTLDEGPHQSYAVQWFIFAAAVLVGWVLAVRYSLRKRQRAATGAPVERTPADSTTSTDDATATVPSGTPSP
jgi:cytochrome oxidase assembly protein ShyY1